MEILTCSLHQMLCFLQTIGICLLYLGGCRKTWCFLIFLNEMKGIKIYSVLCKYGLLMDEPTTRRKKRKRREKNIRHQEMCYEDVYIKNQNMVMASWIDRTCDALSNIKRTICIQFKSLK